MAHTILIVEDQPAVRTMLRDFLEQEGFRTEQAHDGKQGLSVARQFKPDLILLDIMMPGMDGFEFLREYRRDHATPVILLTAKVDETDKVVGLELGADDYVTKPFGMRELLARIRAVLRRRGPGGALPAEVLRAAGVVLDRSQRRVEVGGAELSLTRTEFELLALLMTSPGRVFSRIEILERLRGYGWEGIERTIDVHIRNLRAKMEVDLERPRYVQTVFGVGYRFSGEA